MDWKKHIQKLSNDELDDIRTLISEEFESRRIKRQQEFEKIILDGPPSYVQQKIKCGKKNCKCRTDTENRHGPYWMEIRRIDGKLKTKYIGKTLKIGLNRNNGLVGASFEFKNHGIMTVEGFIDDGIVFRAKGIGMLTASKDNAVYAQLLKYDRQLREDVLRRS